MDNESTVPESAMMPVRLQVAATNSGARFNQILVTAMAMLLLGAGASAQPVSTLSQVRELYQQYTPENFDDGGAVSHYVWKNFVSFFPHATIARTATIRDLEAQHNPAIADFQVSAGQRETGFNDYVMGNSTIDGVIVLVGGKVAYEAYPNMQPYDRHLGWSITKVLVSTALAALEEQGQVEVDVPIEQHLPVLADTEWAGISLRHIVNMSSGIDCQDSDGYQNTETCIYRYEESLGLTAQVNPPQATLETLRSMRQHRPAGEKYEYVSADTFVTGLVVESVTGKPLWLALQDLIWGKIGAEADGLMMISPQGMPATHGGLSARLRDIARFGEIFTTGDYLGVVSQQHLKDLVSANGIAFDAEQLARLDRRFKGDGPGHAAWQWDMIWPDGAMFKGGYSGQGLFVDPGRGVVAAWFGTSGAAGESHALLPMLRQMSRVLF